MINNTLKTEFIPYPDHLLSKWRAGDYTMLSQSDTSEFIKKIIPVKASKRPDRRFFGEAFIASNIVMVDGYYNSFKWLTAGKWKTGKGLKPDLEKPFYNALIEHFGKDTIRNLQQRSLIVYQNSNIQLSGKPVAPDLWIIDKNNHHRFIESKLPGDKISDRQIAGLALIKKHLGGIASVSVSIVCLYPEGAIEPKEKDYSEEFSMFYELC